MNNRNLVLASFVFLIFCFCSEKSNSPISPTSTIEIKIQSAVETVIVFPNTVIEIRLPIISGLDTSDVLNSETIENDSFTITGPYFSSQVNNSICYYIRGKSITPSPISEILTLAVGERSGQIPISVLVSDFFYADKFITNIPGDTLFLNRGSTFRLKITCQDNNGQLVSKSFIDRNILGGKSWGNTTSKIFCAPVSNPVDTMSFMFGIGAYEDDSQNFQDCNSEFRFGISNKKLNLPICVN